MATHTLQLTDASYKIYVTNVPLTNGNTTQFYITALDFSGETYTSGDSISLSPTGSYGEKLQIIDYDGGLIPIYSMAAPISSAYNAPWSLSDFSAHTVEPTSDSPIERYEVYNSYAGKNIYYYRYKTPNGTVSINTSGMPTPNGCITFYGYDNAIWGLFSNGLVRFSSWNWDVNSWGGVAYNASLNPTTNLITIPGSDPGSYTPNLLIQSSSWNTSTLYGNCSFYIQFPQNDTFTFTPTSQAASTYFNGVFDEYIKNNNPYGENDQQGGGGAQTDWNTPIPSDGTPTFDITETGFASVFAPTAAQLKSLSEYLWSDLFSVDTLKKLLADPFQALISLHMLPIAVTRGGAKDVAIGNIGTGVSMSLLDAKAYKVDCGTLNIDAYFGSFFDYSPYTTYQIYLPYIGYQSFTPDDFVGGTCQLVYIIDAVTGACVAQLISSKAGGAVLYQFSGSMGYSIPLSASSYQNFVGSVLSAAGSIVGAVKGFKSASGKFAGLDKASAALSGGSSALSAVQASKPDVSRSGSVGGATGWLANQTPYIIRTRPNAIIAKNQQAYTGYPSYQARKLSSLSGFTQVSYINLSLNGATPSEYDEAERLLKEGVLI